jgi:hypothetical protein
MLVSWLTKSSPPEEMRLDPVQPESESVQSSCTHLKGTLAILPLCCVSLLFSLHLTRRFPEENQLFAQPAI